MLLKPPDDTAEAYGWEAFCRWLQLMKITGNVDIYWNCWVTAIRADKEHDLNGTW